MNKDEIQQSFKYNESRASCGLVMNKDEIQLSRRSMQGNYSCGLVMNKDEIQQQYNFQYAI